MALCPWLYDILDRLDVCFLAVCLELTNRTKTLTKCGDLNFLAIPAFETHPWALTLIHYNYTLTDVLFTLTDVPLWWRALTWSHYELGASDSACVLSFLLL